MIAPLIGGMLDTAFGWQAIFVFIGAVRRRRAGLDGVAAARDPRGRDRRGFRRTSSPTPGSLLTDRDLPRLRAGRGVQLGDVLHLHRRRAARGRHHHAAHLGRIRRLVRRDLAHLHGGQFRRRALVGEIRRRFHDPRRRRRHGARRRDRDRCWVLLAAAARPGSHHDTADDHRLRLRLHAAERDRRRRQRAPAGGRRRLRHSSASCRWGSAPRPRS